MRILTIRFKNLNSLTGEWRIDLTHADYASDGIFAITGPTGSGKTTILDAVCLGLYGRTPRLEKVTKTSNEIMSRQAGDCFAEITFETQKGRYRCHWSQHRARRRPDGELQQARHEIADADSGVVLESRLIQVGEFVEEATGMDFERFTRSMLLARVVAAFLQATPDKRADSGRDPGTEIYSRISVKVHERRGEEREKFEILQAEVKGIRIMEPDEEKKLRSLLLEQQTRETERIAQMDILREASAWRERLAALEAELAALHEMRQKFFNRWTAFAPDAARLESSLRALAIDADYRALEALRNLQDADSKDRSAATFALMDKEKACEEAQASQQAAETGLENALSRQTAETAVIKQVRELDARLSERRAQCDEKDTSIAETAKQEETHVVAIDDGEKKLGEAKQNLEEISAYRIRHTIDSSLLSNLTAIERAFAVLLGAEVKQAKADSELAAAAAAKEAAVATREKFMLEHEQACREYGIHDRDAQDLSDHMNLLLSGREIGRWRTETEAFRDREYRLVQAYDAMERIHRAEAALDELSRVLVTGQTKVDALAAETQAASAKKILLENEVHSLETQVFLLGRIRSLEEERKGLQDDVPCPLCGATDHPYARGNVPELSQAEEMLQAIKVECKQASKRLGEIEAAQAKARTEISFWERERAEKQVVLEKDEKHCRKLLQGLEIDFAREERIVAVSTELAAVRAGSAQASGVVAAVEEKGRQEKIVLSALERSREARDVAARALQEAAYRIETADFTLARLRDHATDLNGETETVRTAILRDIAPFGILELRSNDLSAILQDLAGRRDAWQAKQNQLVVLEKKIYDLTAAVQQERVLLKNVSADREARTRDRDTLTGQIGSLLAARRTLYGEKNPDEEENVLARLVEQAYVSLERIREEGYFVKREHAALSEKISALEERITRRGAELVRGEQAFLERLHLAGFMTETDYRAASLTEQDRAALAEQERSLIIENTALEARRKDRMEALAKEQGKNLTDQPLAALRDQMDTCEAALQQIRGEIGGITQRVRENEKLRNEQGERIATMDLQKMECNRWDELHILIGSADGKKFRNFAQGLTFEMMIDHANRQLVKITDRYLLVRDRSQPLELNVIDNYQAGEVRSTKNLSGGESFIVSLALALGLSHMASRNVRVDSLFLDEGFGTLDEDAMEAALNALAGLRQDGKLIGVISHMNALKDRLATQIQVTPQAGGCSTLSGPGCQFMGR